MVFLRTQEHNGQSGQVAGFCNGRYEAQWIARFGVRRQGAKELFFRAFGTIMGQDLIAIVVFAAGRTLGKEGALKGG